MKVCSVEVCDRPARRNGLCDAHDMRRRRGQSLDGPVRATVVGGTKGACGVDGCEAPAFSRKLCRSHYQAESDIRERTLERDRERHHRRKHDPEYKANMKKRKKRYEATDRGRAAKSEQHRRWRERGGAEWSQNYNLEYRYGITRGQWDEMFAAQGERCAICGSDEPNGRWCTDHDHACCPDGPSCGNCIRGILCLKCNSGLGHFDDDPERLRAAIAYLAD